jgi:hypothetical protein
MGEEALTVQMSKETVAFSEYLIAYGAYFYLLAMKKLCETFCLAVPAALEASIAHTLDRLDHMQEIAVAWLW